MYVLEIDNHRIQKFDSDGNFITKWRSEGNGPAQFYIPRDTAIHSSDNVYVVDTYNNRIQKFDSNGNFLTKWEITSKYNSVQGISVDSSVNVYVVDQGNDGIQVFAPKQK